MIMMFNCNLLLLWVGHLFYCGYAIPDACEFLVLPESHIPLELNEEELESDIAITLSETETIWIFDMPPTAVPADSEEAQEVEEKNTKYQEVT